MDGSQPTRTIRSWSRVGLVTIECKKVLTSSCRVRSPAEGCRRAPSDPRRPKTRVRAMTWRRATGEPCLAASDKETRTFDWSFSLYSALHLSLVQSVIYLQTMWKLLTFKLDDDLLNILDNTWKFPFLTDFKLRRRFSIQLCFFYVCYVRTPSFINRFGWFSVLSQRK